MAMYSNFFSSGERYDLWGCRFIANRRRLILRKPSKKHLKSLTVMNEKNDNKILEAFKAALADWKDRDSRLDRVRLEKDARALDPKLIRALRSVPELEQVLFRHQDGAYFFHGDRFYAFLNHKTFYPDSYTSFAQAIGLADALSQKPIARHSEVVLNFPYKDCMLEGRQTKDDRAQRRERFWNELLAPEEVNRLLSPKVLTNFKRYSQEGEASVEEIDPLKENWLIKGNNLIALHTLKQHFAGQVKLIYIDPPYNTGGEANIFTYNNSFNHSTWLTFMKDRLRIARDLLRNNGFIAIAIDHYELFYLGVLADEIFGRDNRLGIVSVVNNPMGRNQAKFFSTINDFMLVYAKNASIGKFNDVILSEEFLDSFDLEDDIGKYRLQGFVRIGGGDANLRVNKPKFWYPIYVSQSMNDLCLEKKEEYYEVYPITSTGRERTWKLSASSTKKIIHQLIPKEENGRIVIYEKYREEKGQKVSTVWADKKYNANHHGIRLLEKILGRKDFSFPKSLYTVLDILKLMTNKNDIILDFFAGSGTTEHATLALNKEDGRNRKFILVEQLEEHIKVCSERNQKVLAQESISDSFIYCELMTHNEHWHKRIEATHTKGMLQNLWQEMRDKADLSYRLPEEKYNEITRILEEDHEVEHLKNMLKELLDKNMLYVPYSEINDATYKVSDKDKRLNQRFHDG